jgi:hypothetical protein
MGRQNEQIKSPELLAGSNKLQLNIEEDHQRFMFRDTQQTKGGGGGTIRGYKIDTCNSSPAESARTKSSSSTDHNSPRRMSTTNRTTSPTGPPQSRSGFARTTTTSPPTTTLHENITEPEYSVRSNAHRHTESGLKLGAEEEEEEDNTAAAESSIKQLRNIEYVLQGSGARLDELYKKVRVPFPKFTRTLLVLVFFPYHFFVLGFWSGLDHVLFRTKLVLDLVVLMHIGFLSFFYADLTIDS